MNIVERLIVGGGLGSGNFGHRGRPGKVGGSGEGASILPNSASILSTIGEPGGGFTYSPRTGDQPREGYSVAVHEDRGIIVAAKDVNLRLLAEYARSNHDLLSRSDKFMGGWHNDENGKVYLDVSTVVADPHEAERLGRTTKQISFYDLKAGRELVIDYTKAKGHYVKGHTPPRGLEGRHPDSRRSDRDDDSYHRETTDVRRDSRGADDPRWLGGTGSGNFGHSGRPGEVGGSATASTGLGTGSGTRVPLEEIRNLAQSYNAAHGLAPVREGEYAPLDESYARRIADAYDAMPVDDRSPETRAAYEALGREVQAQWDHAEKSGITFETWRKEGQPYANSREMQDDVRQGHLYFFAGGTPNKYLATKDEHGLSLNDKFRAVHDLYGHAAEGYQFGPRGEDNAYRKHVQMFSPLAGRALLTETRGQNSWVNFNRDNFNADGSSKNIPALLKPYATQKAALLPDEFRALGGAGSGNHGHAGRPGEVGGSGPGVLSHEEGYLWHEEGPVADWAINLPREDHRALSNYASFGYHDINDQLRGTYTPPIVNTFVRDATTEEIRRLGYDAQGHFVPAVKNPDGSFRPGHEVDPRDRVTPESVERFGHPGMKDIREYAPDDPYHRVDDGRLYVNANYRPVEGGPKSMFTVQHVGPDVARVESLKKDAAQLNDLIANRGYTIPETLHVGRAAYLPGISQSDLEAKVGSTFEEKGFTSTMVGDNQRLTSYVASGKFESLYNRFHAIKEHEDEVGAAVRMHIELPAGTRVASVEASRRLDFDFPRITNHPDFPESPDVPMTDYRATPKVNTQRLKDKSTRSESEVLLGSGARYHVVSVKRNGDYESGDRSLKPVKIIDVYLRYIGGGSSDGAR